MKTTARKPAIYHTFTFRTQRVTPVRRLPWGGGNVEIILKCSRPSVAMQRRAERIIRRSPHECPLVALIPQHPATHARRLTPAQAAHYEAVCRPL